MAEENHKSNPFVGLIAQLLSLGFIFLLINGLLWACQEVTSMESRRELKEKERELNAIESEINNCELLLDSYKNKATNNALPSHIYTAYKEDLGSCNSLVNEYNSIIPEFNELNKKTSKFYLIPIPRRAARSLK